MTQLTTLPPDWLDRSLYPFQERAFETADGRMNYLDEGEGQPVLIVHGTPTWSFEWREVVRTLRSRSRVIVPDHLGFGRSDKPNEPSILRPIDHARRLLALFDALDLRDVVLVVHDFGGPIGLALALERRERIASVVVANSFLWSLSDDPRIRAMSRLVRSPLGKLLYRGLNASPRWIVPSAVANRAALPSAIHRHYLAPFRSWSERAAPWTLGVELDGSSDFYDSLWRRRSELTMPMSILWGMRDPAFSPTHLARWIEAFPDAQVRRLDVGHFPAEEAPAEAAETISAMLRAEQPRQLSFT